MNANGDNLTPGEILSSARTKASLSLEQVAENTRIPANMLHAIEMDEYHKISGDLYVKSFLRAYSQEVGLDPEEMINIFQAYTGIVPKENEAGGQASWDEQDVKIKRVGFPWGWISFIAVVIALATASFFWVGLGDSDSPEVQTPVTRTIEHQPELTVAAEKETLQSGTAVLDSIPLAVERSDTLAQGWQLESPSLPEAVPEVEIPSTDSFKTTLPPALAADPDIVFEGGKHWPYVVRLVTRDIGQFGVKRDAEISFQQADFPLNKNEATPLPTRELVSGRAYLAREGYVVYWGMEDHLSLRLGHVRGVEVSFNGVVQELGRYRDGEEILLDSSRLGDSTGN